MGRRSTVLVVEDNPQNMMLLSDLIEAQGHAVLQAEDGRRGWELARQHRPDLILMDIQLPDVSGLEVTRWLKNDETLKSIPVVAVTAFAMKGDEARILAEGCDGYVSKPISVCDFLQTLKRFLGGAREAAPQPSAFDFQASFPSARK